MKKKHTLLLVLLLCTIISFSQDILEKENFSNYKGNISENVTKFRQFKFNKTTFLNLLSNIQNRENQKQSNSIISLPNGDGNFVKFKIFEASVLSKELSAKYPNIKSYVGRSLKGNSTVRFSYSPSQGFNAAISSNKNSTIIIKPSNIKTNSYISFLRSDIETESEFECKTIDEIKKKSSNYSKRTNDGALRKYRLAVATTAEFSNFFLDGSETNDTERKTKVLAAINTSLTRINGIFERDFAVTMELVANNDATIYLNPTTDPFTGNFNQELQNTLDVEIGNENYDVGHMFGFENGVYGNAGCIACVCTTDYKGSGFTVHSAPDSDHFNLIASHEFGHQFGGYHVQSSSNCRSSAGLQEVEPGSGSSIMGYAGICSPNVQETPDDYFNYVDIRDVLQWTRNDSSCAELIATGNTDPQVSAGNNFTIPKSTAYILEGRGSDIDTDNILTYCWEENDPENPNSSNFPNSSWVYGPLYRSRPPILEPIRYMPQLSDVLSGNLTPTWEVTPSVSRTLDFVLTVRDNALIGAKTNSDEMTVTVDDSFGPFIVTSQNNEETWNVGDSKTITWDVANTINSPVNANNVDVFLSVDGGYTYPYTLATNISNDGSENIIVPEITTNTSQGRLMVKASNNIFYAVNAANINIESSVFIMSFNENSQTVCNQESATYNFTYKSLLGFNEETSFSVENMPAGVTVSFNPVSASIDGTEVEVLVSNVDNFPIGANQFIIKGTSTTIVKQVALEVNVYNATLPKPLLSFPAENQSNIEKEVVLDWNKDDNAENYFIEIATDDSFNTIVDAATIEKNSYSSLNLQYSTDYFWRVKGINSCIESVFSDIFNFTTLCLEPKRLSVNNLTTTSADIKWVEDGSASLWEVEVVVHGTTPSGSGEVVSSRNFTANNLKSSTKYDVYLKSSCNESDSSLWVGPLTFSTLADFCNGDRFYDSGGVDEDYQNNEYTTTVVSANNADIVEVTFLSFDLGYDDYLYVFDGQGVNETYIGSYSGNNLPPILRSTYGNNLYFYFLSNSSEVKSGWEAEVSCITITCPAPVNLIATNIEATSVDLNWNVNGSETVWEIEYGEAGFTQGNGIIVSTSEKPFKLEGLNPLTSYNIYLRSVCESNPGEDDSFWTTPIYIETPCGVFNAPYFYDVEQQNSQNNENCWTINPEVYSTNYFWNIFNSNFYETTTGPYKAKSGTNYFGTYSYYGTTIGDVTELISPTINIATLNDPVLDFYTFMHGVNVGSLHVDIYNNGIWVEDVFVLEGTQQESSKDFWRENIVDLNGFENTIQIRFRAIAGGNSLTEIDIDDISVIERPTCPNLTELEATNIKSNSVELSWIANGSETKWEIEYGEVGFTLGNGIIQNANANPYLLSGLTPITKYDIYVKSICGENSGEDDSNWVGPISIETPCGIFTAPYFYDVEEEHPEAVGDCWTSTPEPYNTNYFWTSFYNQNYENTTGPYQAKSGFRYFAAYPYYSSTYGDITELTSPQINIGSLSNPVLDFYTFMHGENIGSLHVDILNNGVWTEDVLVINGQQQDNSRDLWEQQLIDLNNFEEVIQIKFRAISGGNGLNEIDIDDISIIEMPTCLNPRNFEVSNITYESAELNWVSGDNETTWQIEYGQVGYTPGNGTKVIATENPYTLSGLNSETSYDIYLRAVCGDNPNEDDSNWVGPITIETPCGIFSAPYFYDVEQQYSTVIDDCWTFTPESYSTYFWASFSNNYNENTTGPYKAKSGYRYFATYPYNYSIVGDVTELISPMIDISSLNDPVLDFYTFMHGENIGSLHVDILNNGVWTEDVLVINGQQQDNSRDLWEQQLIDLNNFEEVIQIKFRAISGGNSLNEIDIDDISVIEMPTCLNPTNFEVSNITYQSAELNWTSGNDETTWQIEYGQVGYSPGTGTKVIATENPYTLSGLNSETSYDIYLRAVCGDNPNEDDSNWVGPITIETPCGIFSAPYFYDVEQQYSTVIDDCWTFTPEAYSTYFWASSYSQNYENTTGPYQAKSGYRYFATFSYNYSTLEEETELISPFIDITPLSVPALDFYSFMYGQNVGSLHVDVFNNGVWTEDVLVINGQQQTNSRDSWEEQLVNLSAFTGIIQIKFRAISGENTYDSEIDIDDISVFEMPTCPSPSNLEAQNITDNSIDLSWTVKGDETTWEIEYGEVGYTLGNGTKKIIDDSSYTVSNLDSQTNYDIYLRSICGSSPGDDDSNWVGPIQVKTTTNYCKGDHFYDSGGEHQYYSNYENEVTVISPISGDYVEVNFLDFDLESCCDRLSVYDGPDVNSPFLGSFSGNNLPGMFTSTHATGSLTFHFTSDGSSTGRGWDAEVNCISLTCPKPTNPIVSNIGANEVTIQWDKGGIESKWQIEYGSPSFNLGNGQRVNTANNPYVLNNLTSETAYQYYIRAVCGNSVDEDDSEWIGPYDFTTICSIVTAPFYENFTAFSTPNCWTEIGSESWNFNINASYDASSAGDHSSSGNTNYAWIDGSYPNGENQISKLRTPWIDISSLSNPGLEFSLFSVNTQNETYNTFKVIVNNDDGVSLELNTVQESTDGWKVYLVDLSNLNLTSKIQVEFEIQENSPGDAYLNDILLDDVKVNELSALNIESNNLYNLKYYPNPVKNRLTIETADQITLIEIFNTLGQKVFRIEPKENKSKIDVNFSSFSIGTYMVKAFSKDKVQTFSIVKERN
ncbi:fibronectin type III domain-containing protein [Polaribacter sp. Hel1_85]|uniref:fibronectin type III domain-containing protein n=1 Tax=Polaribacter sp. Hel1_85 TaxID=1250005 RepID=UPI00052D0609|nr:fibronectin type III domain-containing protein [Polaribacter sp. Hel1_85]KGL63939.1 metallo-peptidase, M12B family [Polaribacter sp. Hel1_85]